MTNEERVELLTQKFHKQTGQLYSVCKISAENSLELFDGINEENADKVAHDICQASLAGENWSILFKAWAKFGVGLIDYSTLIDTISGVLSV